MHKRLAFFFAKAVEYSVYLFIFLLPWQTKIIIRPGVTNFTEISLYFSQLLLLSILIAYFGQQLQRREDSEPISASWIALAVFEAAVLASFFVAPDQALAFYHYAVLLLGVGLFYLLRTGREGNGYEDGLLDKGKAIASFLAGVFCQAVLGLYQFLCQHAPANKFLGLAAHHAEQAGTAVIEAGSGRWLRAYGGLDHPNILGGVLAISLILVAYLLAQRKMIRSWREALSSILLFIFYFISLTALFFTFSRSGWLAYGVGLAGVGVALAWQRDRWIIGRFLALVFFSLIMSFMIAFPYRELAFARTSGAWQGEGRLEQKSLSERWEYLDESKEIIQENWLIGTGVGNYVVVVGKKDGYSQDPWSYQPVHNAYLLLLAQSGVVALVSFLAFLFFFVKKDRRAAYTGAVVAALLVIMIFDHWLISLPFGWIFLLLILGLL